MSALIGHGTWERGAVFGGDHRYRLWRRWSGAKPPVCWCMLNPSVADHMQDDATIRRCVGFAKAWGYGSIEVVNLYNWRSTDMQALVSSPDPIGIWGDESIREGVGIALGSLEYIARGSLGGGVSSEKGLVVCAWGNGPAKLRMFDTRVREVLHILRQLGDVYALGFTKRAQPKHPVRLGAKLQPMKWQSQYAGETLRGHRGGGV